MLIYFLISSSVSKDIASKNECLYIYFFGSLNSVSEPNLFIYIYIYIYIYIFGSLNSVSEPNLVQRQS
jgi:hypothetical protein